MNSSASLGGRNRVSALVNLIWRYLTWRHGGGGLIGDDPPARPGPAEHPASGRTIR